MSRSDGCCPSWMHPKVLEGFGPDSSPKLREASRPITLRHLLTHTAGMSYDMWNADALRYMTFAGGAAAAVGSAAERAGASRDRSRGLAEKAAGSASMAAP